MDRQAGEMKNSFGSDSERTNPPVCLSIAGLDPSGGAGILADVRTFSRFGCYATAVVTSVTFQNTKGVFGAEPQSAESVGRQLGPVFDDLNVRSVKTGMLPDAAVIIAVKEVLVEQEAKNIVVDPVVRSTSGFDLIDDDALRALIEHLFTLASLVTPNLPEAERIVSMPVRNEADVRRAADAMMKMGARNVLIKGGHSDFQRDDGDRTARDFLFTESGEVVFESPFVETTATHGTGCALSSAIAACLANGHDLETSVSLAKEFVTEAIKTAPLVGGGNSPINLDGFGKDKARN